MKMPMLTTPHRTALMKSVGQRNTAPERAVRSFLHRRGFRFRLNVSELPGRPDIVLPRYRTAIFVHGCFWHGHDCRHGSVQAKTNREFWSAKIAANRSRDKRNEAQLEAAGWHVETIWECEARQVTALEQLMGRIRMQLDAAGNSPCPTGHPVEATDRKRGEPDNFETVR